MPRHFAHTSLSRLVFALLLTVCSSSALKAQEDTTLLPTPADSTATTLYRPVYSIFSFEVGKATMLDTYLAQMRYNGLSFQLGYERLQVMRFNPKRWIMEMDLSLNYSAPKNVRGNHKWHSLMLNFQWGMMHRWTNIFTPHLTFLLGGSTSLNCGVIYSQYNSNNPVSAKIRWSLNLSAGVLYNFNIASRLPVTVRYEANLPVIGAFFSPEYDESFYELYLGNRKNIAHFGSWGNRFDLTNKVYVDLHFGSTTLRLGYRNVIETSYVNRLNTQLFYHHFLIGIGGEWVNINPRNPSFDRKSQIISAIY